MVRPYSIYYYIFYDYKFYNSGIQMNVQEDFNKFMKDAKRVLKVSRKPDKAEYIDLAKISALGVVVVGGIGYIIVCLGHVIGL